MRRFRSTRRLGAVTAALTTLIVSSGAQALSDPFCGSTLMQSVTLTADHFCDTGITVGADGITIDLGGFTLNGNNGAMSGNGIDPGGHFGVTIKNGTIRGFNYGVLSGPSVKLSHLTLRNNALQGASLSTASIDNCAFIANAAGGLQLHGGKVTASAFVGNGTFGGMYLNPQADKIIVADVIASLNAGPGINVTAGTKAVSIKGATCTNNTLAGVEVDNATATVSKSTIVGNVGDGVDLEQSGAGFGPPGVVDVIDGNLIAGNGGAGIDLTDGSNGNVITKNRLIGNGGGGMAGDTTAADSLIKGNTVIGNTPSGFDVEAAATFTKNVADANAGEGILAPAAIDGGGNTARGDVAIFPCTGVACPAVFTPTAGSVTPTCGMHVASSIRLGDDLTTCASGDGLLVDADKITIDLNGHDIEGNPNAGGIGINVGAHTHVTIKNGRVRDFDTGIQLATGDALKLDRVEVRGSLHDGVHVATGTVTIGTSALVGNSGNGLFLGDGASAQVSDTYIVMNGADGIEATAPSGKFTKIVVAANTGSGLDLDATSPGNTKVTAATIAGNGNSGITIFGMSSGNVSKSLILGNQEGGINLGNAQGTDVLASNVVAGNRIDGIIAHVPLQSAMLSKNMLLGNGNGDGVLILKAVSAVTISGNTAIGNMDSGFRNDGQTALTYAKNRADANGDEGISAAADATDGGGNTAHANAGVQQCAGPIACK